MERLDLKIIKKRILEMQRQSAADFERTIDTAILQHNYRTSQLEHIAKLCEDNLKLQDTKLEPRFEPERS